MKTKLRQVEAVKMYTIAYDLVSENALCLQPREGEDADEKLEKRKDEARSWLRETRLGFWYGLSNFGRTVNNSVFVVPEENLKDVREFIEKTLKAYEKFAEEFKDLMKIRKPDIVVIEFHESEEGRLRRMAETVLIGDLEKLHEEISKLQKAQILNPKSKGVKPSTKEKYEATIAQVLDLTEDFKIDCPRIQEHAKLLAAKLDEVKVQKQ